MEWPVLAAILVLALIAAGVQALSGFGFSLFIVPFLAILIGPKDTVLLASLLTVATNGVQVVALRHEVNRELVTRFTVGSFAGMPVGLAVLLLVRPGVLQAAIAVAVIVFTLLLMRGLRVHGAGLAGDLATGVVSGVLNTSTSMSGPPIVLYMQGRGIAPREFRATVSAFFLITAAGAVVLLMVAGAARREVFLWAALSLPSVAVGRWAGNWLFERTHDVAFRRIVFGILVLSGVSALFGAIRG